MTQPYKGRLTRPRSQGGLWENPGIYNFVQQPQPQYGNMGPNVNPQNSNPQGILGGAKQGMYFGNVPTPQGMPQSQITRPDWNQNPAPQNIGPLYPPNQPSPNDGGVGYLNSLQQNPSGLLGYGPSKQPNINPRAPYLQPGSQAIAPLAPTPPMAQEMAIPASNSVYNGGNSASSNAISPTSNADAFAGYNPVGTSPFQTDNNFGGGTSPVGNSNFSDMYDLGPVNPNATADMAADTAAFNSGTGVYDPAYKPPTESWWSSATGDMSMADWGNTALNVAKGAGALMQGWGAYKDGKRADKMFEEGQKQFSANYNNQVKTNNTYMEDRQKMRVASSGSAESVDSYMDKNKLDRYS